MTIIYRETDPISGRWTGNSGGIDLSAFQIDQNFYEAISRITTLEAEVSTAVSISYITISGDQLTFHMTDSTSQGPFTVPTATFTDRGAWSALTAYAVNDTFNINGTLYLVIYPHISAATFSAGANDGLGHNYYSALLSLPGNAFPTGGAVGQVPVKSTTADFTVTWGWKFPTGGTARQYLIKVNGTQDNAEWDTPQAGDIGFTPSTASALTATNVAAAIEQAALSGGGGSAAGVSFTPPTSSTLTSTNVQAAIDELDAALVSAMVHGDASFVASPTGNVSTTETAMGLGSGGSAFSVFPQSTGVFVIWIGGMVLNSSAAGDGVTITGRHGTGTAPTNGATTGLGTQFSIPQHFIASTTAGQQGFMVMGKLTGLTLGVAAWFDLSIAAVTAGGATLKDVQFVAVEVG